MLVPDLQKENEVIFLSIRIACAQLRPEFDLHHIKLFKSLADHGCKQRK